MTFTKEQLIEHINGRKEFAEECVSDSTLHPERREYYALSLATLEIALAVLGSRADAEPAREFLPKNLDRALGVVGVALPESREEFNLQSERWIQRLIDRVIRYADEFKEQPAPVVVPNDVLNRLEHEANHVTAWHHMDEHSCKVSRRDLLTLVNACRSSVFQGKAEPFQEWIPCSERMPETDGNYWGWWNESKRQGPVWFIKSDLQAQFQSSEITHWMPLPAAPKQEAQEVKK
ncbi:DUF551 domain-containing protein [Atlantibacter hermannii]|uniref:DUF551 domain-containing protein n=1 Tax=Atlantibacter hermannii TaxID=565 RepID=UPI0028A69103|nr:DUF551 domain-containing protein [Atlantibacter hermannii]